MSRNLETVETQDTPTSNTSTDSATPFLNGSRANTHRKGNPMADIVTGSITGYVNNNPEVTLAAINDTRRENTLDHATINLENMKGFDRVNADVLQSAWKGTDAVKDARFDLATRIGEAKESTQRDMTAYFIASTQAANDSAREIAGLKSASDMTAQKLALDVAAGAQAAASAAMLAAEKIGTAQALATAALGKEVMLGQGILERTVIADGSATRALINDLKYHDLNRHLVERNTEIVELAAERRGWRDRWDDARQNQYASQFAALQNQLQAFQSQFQTATQGTVNFGSMSGNAGRNQSTNNIV